jgi:hypothetical protein
MAKCVRSRRPPNAPVDVGYRTPVVAHLASLAYRARRRSQPGRRSDLRVYGTARADRARAVARSAPRVFRADMAACSSSSASSECPVAR